MEKKDLNEFGRYALLAVLWLLAVLLVFCEPDFLGCSVQALRKRCERGGPPYHKKDGVTVFSRRELNEYYLKD